MAVPSKMQSNTTKLANSSTPVPGRPPSLDSITKSSAPAGTQSESKLTSSGRTVYPPQRFDRVVYTQQERRQQSSAREDLPRETNTTVSAAVPSPDHRDRWKKTKLIQELDRLGQQNGKLNRRIQYLERKNQNLQQEALDRGSKKEASVETDHVVERKLRKLFRDTAAWSEKWSTEDRLSDAIAKFKKTTSHLSARGLLSQRTSQNIMGLEQADMRPRHLFTMLLNEMICFNTFKRPFGYFGHVGEGMDEDMAHYVEPCFDLTVNLAMNRSVEAANNLRASIHRTFGLCPETGEAQPADSPLMEKFQQARDSYSESIAQTFLDAYVPFMRRDFDAQWKDRKGISRKKSLCGIVKFAVDLVCDLNAQNPEFRILSLDEEAAESGLLGNSSEKRREPDDEIEGEYHDGTGNTQKGSSKKAKLNHQAEEEPEAKAENDFGQEDNTIDLT